MSGDYRERGAAFKAEVGLRIICENLNACTLQQIHSSSQKIAGTFTTQTTTNTWITTGGTMKNLRFISIALFLLFLEISPAGAASLSESASLLPEHLAAKAEMAANSKTVTIFINEKDPEKALVLLNTSNDNYAKKGWSVFGIFPYIHTSDFQGFFVTYQKSLIIE